MIRSIVTIIVLFVMEGNSLISTHKQIFIKKWLPFLSEYFYSLFGTCVESNKIIRSLKLKNAVLESHFTAGKVYEPYFVDGLFLFLFVAD